MYKFGFYGVASDILGPKGPVRGVAWSRTVFNPAPGYSLASAETALKESNLWTKTDIFIFEVVVPRSPIPFLLRALKNLSATPDAGSFLWGSEVTCRARFISLSVVSPIAETTTTSFSPSSPRFLILAATFLIFSGVDTYEPPYFWTVKNYHLP